jgi:hypothetical protein
MRASANPCYLGKLTFSVSTDFRLLGNLVKRT